MKIKNVAIELVIPYANNPRINDDGVNKLAASIKEFGFRQPIVVDKDYVIIVGHTRLKAAQKLGLKTVPINIAEDLTAAQVKAYRIADNRIAEEADWDKIKLSGELEEVEEDFPDLDLSLLGFDVDELEKLRVSFEDVKEEEYDESIIDGKDLIVTFKVSIPDEEATSFENQLDELLAKFPTAKMEKKI